MPLAQQIPIDYIDKDRPARCPNCHHLLFTGFMLGEIKCKKCSEVICFSIIWSKVVKKQ